MKFTTALISLSLVALASPIGAQEEQATLSAYSEVAGTYVNVNVLDVKQTPMHQQDFCTLLTGSYCYPRVGDGVLTSTPK